MNLLTFILILMLGLLVSNIVGHYLPAIPMALTQILFGVILALAIGDYHFEIEAEWFLLLFVAPILYNDGRHFPREELWGMKAQILGNAILLVIFTTVICGFAIHMLIPGIPIAAALALAAILSPTDPVAVTGIAKRTNIPEKVMVLVKGESLINDASGLVAFKYAITAAVTGYFSLQEAILDFSYTFIIGAVAGIVLALLVTFIRFSLNKNGINDPVFHSLFHILTPFGIYMVTEDVLKASGVIGVVAAGLVHSIIKEQAETYRAEEQVLTESTWSIVLFVLNGLVFLLLGMNIPSAMIDIISDPNIWIWVAIGYVVVMGFTVLAVRFIWSYITSAQSYYFSGKKDAEKPTAKNALITSLVGVRGAVTMAGIMSVPVFLSNGERFPLRSLIVFIAAGVILLSLILATVLLPLLCKQNVEEKEKDDLDLTWSKNRLLLTAIKKIKEETNDENRDAALELINEYTATFQRNLSARNLDEEETEYYNRKINEARIIGINLEREYIDKLLEKREIDALVYNTMNKLLDHREQTIENGFRFGTLQFFKKSMRELSRAWVKKDKKETYPLDNIHFIKDIRINAINAAIQGLGKYAKVQRHPEYVYAVQLEYERMLQRLKRPGDENTDRIEQIKEELRFKVLDAERNEIRRMYEAGEITAEQEKELRRYTNYIESIVLFEPYE